MAELKDYSSACRTSWHMVTLVGDHVDYDPTAQTAMFGEYIVDPLTSSTALHASTTKDERYRAAWLRGAVIQLTEAVSNEPQTFVKQLRARCSVMLHQVQRQRYYVFDLYIRTVKAIIKNTTHVSSPEGDVWCYNEEILANFAMNSVCHPRRRYGPEEPRTSD